jgi:hypothetical protein
MIAMKMTAYPSVRKTALEPPEPVELEFARDTSNTASGSLALHANTTGSANTASGEGALASNKVVTSVLFELITARHERRSLFITANQPFGEWGKIFPGDPAMALAAADRLGRRAPLI